MATSGTTTFELDVSDVIEEAYERIGIEIRTGYQAKTARRSLNLLLQHLSNKQINLWKLVLTSQALIQGTTSYTLASDIMDVQDVVLRRGTSDTTMNRLSRQEYQTRPNKTSQGRPSQFWIERLSTPVMHIYLAPENSTDTVRFYAMERIEDIAGSQNTIDIPSRFAPAIISGLTYQLAIKNKPELIQPMKLIYDEELNAALDEDRERVPFKIVPKIARV
jgi:hypothetical protein